MWSDNIFKPDRERRNAKLALGEFPRNMRRVVVEDAGRAVDISKRVPFGPSKAAALSDSCEPCFSTGREILSTTPWRARIQPLESVV